MSTKKTQYCQNNPKNSYTEKKAKHKPSGYAWCSICSFDDTKNKHYFYRGKDCIEKFCKDLKELGTEIINFEENEMITLTNKEIKSYEKQKVCHICEKKFCDDKNKNSEYDLYHKVRYHCHYTRNFRAAAHNICNLRYNVPKKIPIVFHNGSTYDYHFAIKKLAEEFKGDFECLGENTVSVLLKKENDGKITYKLKFIASYSFIQSSLSNLVITYLKFMIKDVKNAWKEKKLG